MQRTKLILVGQKQRRYVHAIKGVIARPAVAINVHAVDGQVVHALPNTTKPAANAITHKQIVHVLVRATHVVLVNALARSGAVQFVMVLVLHIQAVVYATVEKLNNRKTLIPIKNIRQVNGLTTVYLQKRTAKWLVCFKIKQVSVGFRVHQ